MPGDMCVVEMVGIFHLVIDANPGRLQDFKSGEETTQTGGRPLVRHANADRYLEAMLVSLLTGGLAILGAGFADRTE